MKKSPPHNLSFDFLKLASELDPPTSKKQREPSNIEAASTLPGSSEHGFSGQSLNDARLGSTMAVFDAELAALLPLAIDARPEDASRTAQRRAAENSQPKERPGASADAPLGVGTLARALRNLLNQTYAESLWLVGEVSGLRKASSGHMYFTLKDPDGDAVLDVSVYRTSITPRVSRIVQDGQQIKLRGKPTFWEPRGRIQFVADRVEPAGKGAQLEALLRLKEQLTKEGLFAEGKKRPLPPSPRMVGVVTSRTGAVIHDIRKVAFRRGSVHLLLAPATVQGTNAGASIVRALELLQRVREVDVIILARGGGSAEDLACFNEERVVRAVANCCVPIVSAVGHEVDVTLADFAADVRAATPSQAAELVIRDQALDRREWQAASGRLSRAIQHVQLQKERALAKLQQRVSDPRPLVANLRDELDLASEAATRAIRNHLRKKRTGLDSQGVALTKHNPAAVLRSQQAELQRLTARAHASVISVRNEAKRRHQVGTASLEALSPLRVLARGYAIAFGPDGKALTNARDVVLGENIGIHLHRGSLSAQVIEVSANTLDNDGSDQTHDVATTAHQSHS
jgi:exodeoxyribonuclease VII large subunit